MATPAAILQIVVTAQAAQAFKVLDATDRKTQATASRAERNATKVADAVSKAAKFGALGVVGGLALSAKAAADFESHFAEVRKTVNTNAAGFAKLEKGIRRMARTIPVSANELSDLAGQAGALGIKSKDLLRFTRTAAELGISTNLSAEDAANALARLANIMGTSGKDFRRLGSTLVRLGNNGASTEAEIAAMALRISGAGKQIGLSESQVLAYASALASVGIEAEAGGSAISRVFVNIATAVNAGGRSLDGFAKVAGMSSDAYAKAFRANAAGATLRFIEGLDRMKRSGGDVFSTLEKLRLGEIRVRDALLRASGAGRLFREQLAIGNDEWRRNTALTREASQRYRTTAARFEVLKNRVVDFGIGIGQHLLPHLNRLMAVLSNDRLTSEEKFDRISRMLGPLVSQGVEKAADIAGQAGPKIIGALALGIATAWTDMTPLAKLFTVGGLLVAFGGKRAIISAGIGIGRILGVGVAAGTATGVGGGGAAGAAAGGALAGLRGGLLRAAKGGALIAVGTYLADTVMNEFSRRAMTKSEDVMTMLKGKTMLGGATGAHGRPLGFLPDISPNILGQLPGVGNTFDKPSGENERAIALLRTFEGLGGARRVITAEQARQIDNDVALLNLTDQQRRKMEPIVGLLRDAAALRLKVRLGDIAIEPQIRRALNAIGYLKMGWGTSMADILKVSRRNMKLIGDTLGLGSERGRKLAADNMRATAAAIKQQMERSGNVTKAGMERVRALIRNANLADPSRRQAEAFGHQWAAGMDRSKEITRRGVRQMIAEAQKMPGPMRKVALDTWMAQLESARRNGTITAGEFRRLRSRVAAEFTGMRGDAKDTSRSVPASIASMVSRSTDGLMVLAGNVNKTLTAFGARALKFDLKKVDAQRRQTGGVIVPGQGSGDKVHAMLEPGEVVWNRKAVAAMGGASTVDAVNKKIPRFQTGGIVGGIPDADGALPGLDALAMVMGQRFGLGVTAGKNSHGTYTTTGNVSDHSWGGAVDLSNGVTTPQEDAAYAYLTHAPISKAIKQILYRTMTGGNHFNHIHVALLPEFANSSAAVLSLLGAGELPRLLLDGPDGALKTMGQQALDQTRGAGDRAIQAALSSMRPLTGAGGGTDVLGSGAGRVLGASTFGGPGDPGTGSQGYMGDHLDGKMAFAELNMGTAMGGLPYGKQLQIAANGRSVTASKLDIGAGGGDVAGHPRVIDLWYETARALGLPDVWTGLVQAQGFRGGGIVQALQQGGLAATAAKARGRADRGPRVDPVTGQLGNVLRLIRRRARIPKRHKAMANAMRLISDIGLPAGRQQEIHDLSLRADVANEYATRAAALSYDLLYASRLPFLGPDGIAIPGRFHEIGDPVLDAENRPTRHAEAINGMVDHEWVRQQMDALFNLRNRLIEAEGIVSEEQKRTAKLLKEARERLAAINDLIRRAMRLRERVAKALRKAERELEDARHGEADIPGLKDKVFNARESLTTALRHPRENAGRIPHLREKLAEAENDLARAQRGRNAVPGLRDQVRGLRERLSGIDGTLRTRRAMQAAVVKAIGTSDSGLIGKQSALVDYRGDILGTNGEGFKGLQTVQGVAAPMEVLQDMPPMGILGGEIFDAFQSWTDITKLRDPVIFDDGSSGPDDSERVSLLTQLLQESQQRAFVANQQFAVLRNLGDLPFGGIFHQGGMVPGPASQEYMTILRGREGVLTPEQMAVTSAALVSGGSGRDVSVQVIVNGSITSDSANPVTVRIDGQEFHAAVQQSNRRSLRGAATSGRAGALKR